MNENIKIEKEQKLLFYIYIGVFVDVLLIGGIGLYFFDGLNVLSETQSILKTIGIMLMLISIPLGMKLFNDKTKPIDEMEDLLAAWKIYLKWWSVRGAFIVGALFVNLFLYVFLRDDSLFYCVLISLFAWLFCKPDKLKKVENITETKIEEKEQNRF